MGLLNLLKGGKAKRMKFYKSGRYEVFQQVLLIASMQGDESAVLLNRKLRAMPLFADLSKSMLSRRHSQAREVNEWLKANGLAIIRE